ncbi:hypothetical protein SESBI_09362 [Sesbania bispinosa]|nr:hypothetical protein SESBI_09362 [Sesbania bispinosa]
MAEIVNHIPETEDKTQTARELQNIHFAYRLTGKNYLKWSQLIRTILKGKGKGSHLTDNAPDEMDAKFKSWDEEDSMIMAWLWNSMVPEISDTCMFLKSTKEIWEAVEQTYSKAKDAAQIYDIKVRIQIMGKEKVSGLNEVIAIIRSEESRRELMLETPTTESSAMIAEGGTTMVANQKKSSREWGQKGGPQKGGGQGQAHIVNGQSEECVQLNHEEIERVRSFLSKLEKPTGTCSLTYSGQELRGDDWTC